MIRRPDSQMKLQLALDALDECPIPDVLLSTIQNLGSNTRIVVTSRPVFNKLTSLYPSLRIRASDNDLCTIIDTAFTMHPLVRFYDLQIAVKERILQKAEGVFLLAEVQLGYLERQAGISKNAIRHALEIIPKTVYDFYDDIMEYLLTLMIHLETWHCERSCLLHMLSGA